MKKTYLFIFIFSLLLIFSCTKQFRNRDELYKAKQFIKENSVWVFSNKKDIGKKVKNVKKKARLEFGDKITVLENKLINEEKYYRIQLENKQKYWIKKDSLAKKIIVIMKKDILCYKFPDKNFAMNLKLQPGDLGILIKKNNNWLNIDFWAYRADKKNGKREFVGNKWIKNDKKVYTDKSNIVKEAYYLYQAYYYAFVDKGHEKNIAIFFLKKGLKISAATKKKSEITKMIKNLLDRLEKE